MVSMDANPGGRVGSNINRNNLHANWDIPDRYEVRHIIGNGSYGQVCEAYDKITKKVVAIKKVHRVFEDLIDCKRILREIGILNRLKHERIVKQLDICIPRDLFKFDELYLVLEIADSDLKKLFKQNVHLTETHVKALLHNLLIGLKYIHTAGIYHRDLKPANCLVNQDCTVKICDFGLARTVTTPTAADFSSSTTGPAGFPTQSATTTEIENTNPSQQQIKDANMKRKLTGHVVTRWYRAPELILLQESYDSAIDIWSIGCIFAELLGMMKENVPSSSDRTPIFPGSSCFPLSPDQKHANDYKFHTKGNRDQLNVIFDVLGTPTDEDIAALEKEDARKYIRIFARRAGVDLRVKFPGCSQEAVDLLKRMLVFNPSKRITVDEALESTYFDTTVGRSSSSIAAASCNEPVVLPFDDWRPMTEPQLRVAFLEEIRRFHPELQVPSQLVSAASQAKNSTRS